MPEAPIPATEAERVAALRALHVLDTASEERFDRITRLATHVFDVPIALISLVDVSRQWFKSCVGLPDAQMPRSLSFCAYAILGDEPLIIRDAREDPRFADNPLVTEEPYIRFYAGQPLRGPEGHKVGTLCIIDRKPRDLTAADVAALRDLAVWAENELNTVEMSQAVLIQRESEARVRAVMESVPDGTLTVTADGVVESFNAAAERIFGSSATEVLGQHIGRFIAEPYRAEIAELLLDSPKEREGQIAHREIEGVRKTAADGEERFPMELTVTGLHLDGQERSILIARDISERRKAEAALREAYQFNADVIANADEGIVVYDHELRYLLWNPFMEQLTGLTFSQIAGKSALELFPQLRRQEIYGLLQRTLQGEVVRSRDVPYQIRETGKTGWIIGSYAPHRDASGTVVGVIGIITDITERKRAEEALQESEERYRTLVETSPDAIVLLDLQGTVLMVNQQGADLAGYESPTELIGTSVFDLVAPEAWLRVQEDMQKTSELGTVSNVQYTLKKKGGGAIPVEASGSVILGHNGDPRSFIAVFRDITDRQRNEDLRARLFAREQAARAEAEAAEAELAAVVEQMPSGVMAVDRDGQMTFINDAGWRILGTFPSTSVPVIEQAPVYTMRDPASGRSLRPDEAPLARALRGETVQGMEYTFRRQKDAEEICLRTSAVPLRDAEERITGAVAVFSDVTQERKLLEDLTASQEVLRQSEARFRALWEMSADAMALSDPDGIVLRANHAYYQLYGYGPEDVIGKSFAVIFPPEVREWAVEEYKRTFHSPEIAPAVESLIRRSDGSERIVESRYDFLLEDGKRVAMLSAIRDITDRKQVERALQESNHRITNILERITDSFFALDRDWTFTFVNQHAARLLHRDRDELLNKNMWQEFPEARDTLFYWKYHQAMAEQTPVHFEEFYPPLNLWIEVHAYPSSDGLSVYFNDISERRRREKRGRPVTSAGG